MTKLLPLFVLLALACTVATPAYAVNITDKLSNVGTAAGYTEGQPNLATTIGKIIQGLLSLLGIIFIAYTIYAGYLWMTARGKEETIEKAKAIIRGSIVGIIVVLGAYAITAFVLTRVAEATKFAI